MTPFELVFGLLTIIASLALTHLLSGFVEVLRNTERVRFSPQHALWAWVALTSTISNWASFWPMHSATSFPAWVVLIMVFAMIVQYVFCAFVTPERGTDGMVDLVDFHRRERHRYILAAVVLWILSIAVNSALGAADLYSEWWRDNVFSLVDLALTVLALSRRAETFAVVVLAVLSTYYATITCNVSAA